MPVPVRVETVSIPASELVPKELGAAVELLRPYWSTASICTFLGSSHTLQVDIVALDAICLSTLAVCSVRAVPAGVAGGTNLLLTAPA